MKFQNLSMGGLIRMRSWQKSYKYSPFSIKQLTSTQNVKAPNLSLKARFHFSEMQTIFQQNCPAKYGQDLSEASEQILRFESYSFRKLTMKHYDQALELLARQFAAQQPLTNAYYRKYPSLSSRKVDGWRQFWKRWLVDACTNNISVAVLDENSRDSVVAVFVAKDLHYEPQGFNEEFMAKMSFIKPVIDLQTEMLKLVDPHLQQELSKRSCIMDMWGVAIHTKHAGKKLLSKMIMMNEKLAIKQNYRYSFCYGSNFKTRRSLEKLGYQLIAQTDATQYEVDGVRYFSEIEEEQRYPSLWLKPLPST